MPTSWQWAEAGELAAVVGGGTPTASDPANFATDGIPWLTPADLTGFTGSHVGSGARSLSQVGYSSSGAQILPTGSVLFTSRAPIGYCVVAANPISTNQGFKSLVLKGDLVPEFVRYYLVSSKEYAESLASGTTFLELSGARMKALEIPVAPVPEQRRIVAKLDDLRARSRKAREALDEVPALLDKLKQSVLAAAFRGDLTAEWRAAHPDVEPASVLLERIRVERRRRWEEANPKKRYVEPEPVDAEGLPELPEGWCWATVDMLSRRVSVGHVGPTSEHYVGTGGVPLLRSQNVRMGYLSTTGMAFITHEFHQQLSKSLLEAGDLLVVRVGANRGDTCVVPAGLPEMNCANVVFTKPILELGPWIAAFLASPLGRTYLMQLSSGSAQGVLNTTSVATVPIPVASEAERQRIVSMVGTMTEVFRAQLSQQHRMAADLNSLDQSILAKAFRGELVPQDPTDEPADVLLARIKSEAGPTEPKRGRGRPPKQANR